MESRLARALACGLGDRGYEIWPDRGVTVHIERTAAGDHLLRSGDGPQETVWSVG